MKLLKGIPGIISPELMKVLMEMGHGDEIVLADRNFPAASCGQRLIRSDGHTIPDLLKAILQFFPLDYRVERPAVVMELLPGEPNPVVWEQYAKLIQDSEGNFNGFEEVERFAFYERSKQAYAIVATGDRSFKGNLTLKKGVVKDE
jgi:L-fucose mutarotase